MKLFVSYRSTDSKKVDPIVARLRSLKYEVWFDKDSIPAGQDWWEAICEGIEQCQVFIFMVSLESVKSPNCQAELNYAHQLNLPVIPVVLEGEWVYNERGKYDIAFWDDVPSELQDDDNRGQFLFYEGITFIDGLGRGIAKIQEQPRPRLHATRPPDPRKATDASNNITVIYDEACDFALRGEFETAEKLFRKLINRKDTYGVFSHGWVTLIRDYKELREEAIRQNTRKIAQTKWLVYTQQFPKDFIDDLFDPKNVSEIFVKTPPPPPMSELDKAIARARAFNGKRNSDWTPYIAKLGDIDPTTPLPDLEMCLVPVGKFMMGSDDRDSDEKPAHEQRITQPYWLARYPITNRQWALGVKAGAVKEPNDTTWYKDSSMADCPVVNVAWFQSLAFSQWAKCLLPTEPLWEYGARGVENWVYPWGNDWEDGKRVIWTESSGGKPNPVTSKPEGASWVGAMHLSGNVWEWQLSKYKPYKYESDDGREVIDESLDVRALRGGSWFNYVTYWFRSACRYLNDPLLRDDGSWGFRLFRS
jgi:iron(II)-dependent oxidoreductase